MPRPLKENLMSKPTTPDAIGQAYHYLANATTDLPEIAPDTILSRTLHSDPLIKVILFGFAPGQELSEHTSARSVLLHFISGNADLVLGSDLHKAQAGTLVHMPPNLPHSVIAHEPTYMLLIMVEAKA
jgi:quercetin dioxygenase-like cupin family protein